MLACAGERTYPLTNQSDVGHVNTYLDNLRPDISNMVFVVNNLDGV